MPAFGGKTDAIPGKTNHTWFKAEKVGYFVPVNGELEDKTTLVPMDGKDGLFGKLDKCAAERKLLSGYIDNHNIDKVRAAAQRVLDALWEMLSGVCRRHAIAC